jgi:elongation factor Ts
MKNNFSVQDVQKLREKTGLGVMECKRALTEAKGDFKKAESVLAKKGVATAAKKAERATSQGLVDCYLHNNKIGVLIEVNCETDFVSRNSEFKALVHDLCMQIASMNPKNVEELLKQEFIKDPSIKIGDLINSAIQKIGENIKIKRFVRYELGE